MVIGCRQYHFSIRPVSIGLGLIFSGQIPVRPHSFARSLAACLPFPQVIKGFDKAVMGLEVAGTRKLRLDPADAYGERNPELSMKVPISQAPKGLEAGMQVRPAAARRSVFISAATLSGCRRQWHHCSTGFQFASWMTNGSVRFLPLQPCFQMMFWMTICPVQCSSPRYKHCANSDSAEVYPGIIHCSSSRWRRAQASPGHHPPFQCSSLRASSGRRGEHPHAMYLAN